MGINKILITVALFGLGIGTSYSEEPVSQQQYVVTNETGDTLWYVNNDFDGLWFQLPNGMKIEKGSQFTGLYPDGSFGINIMKINQPSTRKIAVDLCKRTADSFHIPRSGVKKVSFQGLKGAQAEGKIDGKTVTIVVVPFDEHQVQIVLMADDNRTDWTRHFLSTLKK